MRISPLPLLLLAAALAPSSVQAQIVEAYATFSPARFSNVYTGTTSGPLGSTPQYTNFWAPGIGGGVTFGLIPVGPVRLGLDLRGSTKPGTTGADTAMAGLKLSFHPPLLRLKPYIQGSGGYVATRTANRTSYAGVPASGTFENQYAAYEVFGGLDVPVFPFIDLRVIEVGGGKGYSVNGYSVGSDQITLFTLNTGVVVHF